MSCAALSFVRPNTSSARRRRRTRIVAARWSHRQTHELRTVFPRVLASSGDQVISRDTFLRLIPRGAPCVSRRSICLNGMVYSGPPFVFAGDALVMPWASICDEFGHGGSAYDELGHRVGPNPQSVDFVPVAVEVHEFSCVDVLVSPVVESQGLQEVPEVAIRHERYSLDPCSAHVRSLDQYASLVQFIPDQSDEVQGNLDPHFAGHLVDLYGSAGQLDAFDGSVDSAGLLEEFCGFAGHLELDESFGSAGQLEESVGSVSHAWCCPEVRGLDVLPLGVSYSGGTQLVVPHVPHDACCPVMPCVLDVLHVPRESYFMPCALEVSKASDATCISSCDCILEAVYDGDGLEQGISIEADEPFNTCSVLVHTSDADGVVASTCHRNATTQDAQVCNLECSLGFVDIHRNSSRTVADACDSAICSAYSVAAGAIADADKNAKGAVHIAVADVLLSSIVPVPRDLLPVADALLSCIVPDPCEASEWVDADTCDTVDFAESVVVVIAPVSEESSAITDADVSGPADAECPVFASSRTGSEWFEGIAECGCVRCALVRDFCCGVRAEIERLSDTREIVLTDCGDLFVSDVNCVVCRALAGDLRLGSHSSLLQSPTAWRLIAKMIGAQLVDLREVLGLANGSELIEKVVGLFVGRCADLFFGCLTKAASSSGGEL
jgi:hypothetical protein